MKRQQMYNRDAGDFSVEPYRAWRKYDGLGNQLSFCGYFRNHFNLDKDTGN